MNKNKKGYVDNTENCSHDYIIEKNEVSRTESRRAWTQDKYRDIVFHYLMFCRKCGDIKLDKIVSYTPDSDSDLEYKLQNGDE